MYEEYGDKSYHHRSVAVWKMELLVKERLDRGPDGRIILDLVAASEAGLQQHPSAAGPGSETGSGAMGAQGLLLMSTAKMALLDPPRLETPRVRPEGGSLTEADDVDYTLQQCDSTCSVRCGDAFGAGPDRATEGFMPQCNYYRHSAFIGGSKRCTRLKLHCTYSRLRRLRLSLTNERYFNQNGGQSHPAWGSECGLGEQELRNNCHPAEADNTELFNLGTSDVEETFAFLKAGATRPVNCPGQPEIPPNDAVRNYLLERIVENARFKRRQAENCKF